jgi:hypothetical protein
VGDPVFADLAPVDAETRDMDHQPAPDRHRDVRGRTAAPGRGYGDDGGTGAGERGVAAVFEREIGQCLRPATAGGVRTIERGSAVLNGMIIEIAVASTLSQTTKRLDLYSSPDRHYWRVRHIEEGEEADAECDWGPLDAAVRWAQQQRLPVAWRYYETGVE